MAPDLHVFVYDRERHLAQMASVTGDGTPGNSLSANPSISADGRYVAFQSFAFNLSDRDHSADVDIYIHDRGTGKTELASVARNGYGGGGSHPAISGNGRYVAFSGCNKCVPNQTLSQMFVRDRVTDTTELASVGYDGAEPNGNAWGRLAISHDGRYVAFRSNATNLVRGGTDGNGHIFVRDRLAGSTEVVSVASDGTPENQVGRSGPAISMDGRFVAFDSGGDNLVENDFNWSVDIFVRDRGPATGVGELDAFTFQGRITASGWATFSGAIVTAASPRPVCPAGDLPTRAHLHRAAVVYRPETGDLLYHLSPCWIHGTPDDVVVQTGEGYVRQRIGTASTSGVPGILYGLKLQAAGATWEVRAAASAQYGSPLGMDPSDLPSRFALYRCNPSCVETATLSGGVGTTGHDVWVSVPLSALGVAEGTTISGLEAFSAVGEVATGSLQPVDSIPLPDGQIPVSSIVLGIAPTGTLEGQVDFDTPASLSQGWFQGDLDTSALVPGKYDVWARACLGGSCGAMSARTAVP